LVQKCSSYPWTKEQINERMEEWMERGTKKKMKEWALRNNYTDRQSLI